MTRTPGVLRGRRMARRLMKDECVIQEQQPDESWIDARTCQCAVETMMTGQAGTSDPSDVGLGRLLLEHIYVPYETPVSHGDRVRHSPTNRLMTVGEVGTGTLLGIKTLSANKQGLSVPYVRIQLTRLDPDTGNRFFIPVQSVQLALDPKSEDNNEERQSGGYLIKEAPFDVQVDDTFAHPGGGFGRVTHVAPVQGDRIEARYALYS